MRNIGVVETIDDIKNNMIGLHFGKPIFVRDVAQVVEAPRQNRVMAVLIGKLRGRDDQKQPGADTVTLTRNLSRDC